MAIAKNYKYMKNAGATPRFEEAFAFKHILNAEDSALFLANSNPLDKVGARLTVGTVGLLPNSERAYTQAMNRFNTPGVTTTTETILEAADDPPKPMATKAKSGRVTYHLLVVRGWKFIRIDNNNQAPNHTKYEAQLAAQFTTRREANLSCMASPGVVNHWDQSQNGAWFG